MLEALRAWARQHPRRAAAALGTPASVGAFLVIWGGLGDLSEPGGYTELLHLPVVARWVEILVAGVGVILVIGVLAIVWTAYSDLDDNATSIAGLVLLAGALAAAAWRGS